MTTQKVALVTGSNKGIGFAIVKGLCEKFNGIVYLTARDVDRGQAAVDKLKTLNLNPKFHQLDITDDQSINTLRDHIKTTHGGLDLLINNAAIAFDSTAPEPIEIQAEQTIGVNYFGTLKICEALFPLLRNNAKVVNLSSSAGHLSRIPSTDLQLKFKDSNLTIPQLNQLMEQFIKDVKTEKYLENGWGNSTYVVSKVGISALTIIQQRQFDKEQPFRNISVNSVHPGYVDTDMTGHKGVLTIEEGAKAPLWLALKADIKGKYVWFNSTIVEWDAASTPPKV